MSALRRFACWLGLHPSRPGDAGLVFFCTHCGRLSPGKAFHND